MRELNTDAYFAAMKQIKRDILKNTDSLCMMLSNNFANIAAIKQLQTEVLKNTKSLCMMESNTLANFAAIKQLQSKILKSTKSSVHDGVIYPCRHCSYQATSDQTPKICASKSQ